MSYREDLNPEHLLRIKNETLKILARRGYIINDPESLTMSAADFARNLENKAKIANTDSKASVMIPQLYIRSKKSKPTYRTLISNVYEYAEDRTKLFLVYFADMRDIASKSVPIDEAKDFSQLYSELGCKGGMFISYGNLSTPATQYIREISFADLEVKDEDASYIQNFIQIFKDSELLYDPLTHIWASRFEIVPISIVRKLKEEKSITPSQFPKMCYDDPIAKRLGLRPGNVVKCYRHHIVSDSMVNSSITYLQITAPPTRKKERTEKKEKA